MNYTILEKKTIPDLINAVNRFSYRNSHMILAGGMGSYKNDKGENIFFQTFIEKESGSYYDPHCAHH
jgi:hypothetical protein